MLKSFFVNMVEDFLRPLSGGLGFALRRWYYRNRLHACGKNVRIDTGVFFSAPENISIGNDVWIDKHSHLIAGWPGIAETKTRRIAMSNQDVQQGMIVIGDHAHIGIGTIIQGHGGVRIGNCFTASADCKIYSLSNDPSKCRMGTHNKDANGDIYYVITPVNIGDNVWLGINTTVIGNTIQNDCFIQPNSVVVSDIKAGSVAAGFPAQRIKPRFKTQ
jgi:acetyltransferase-like isoleucine patch superfamily enzyme